jgi:hypothetical protein
MAKLVIKDLTDSVELDRQAMAAIVGGARIFPQHIRRLPMCPLPPRRAIRRAARHGSRHSKQRHALNARAVCV